MGFVASDYFPWLFTRATSTAWFRMAHAEGDHPSIHPSTSKKKKGNILITWYLVFENNKWIVLRNGYRRAGRQRQVNGSSRQQWEYPYGYLLIDRGLIKHIHMRVESYCHLLRFLPCFLFKILFFRRFYDWIESLFCIEKMPWHLNWPLKSLQKETPLRAEDRCEHYVIQLILCWSVPISDIESEIKFLNQAGGGAAWIMQ